MSVLLIGLADDVSEEAIRRLRAEGDEVRILEPNGARVDRWKESGAHVAVGSPEDDDLISRAATNCRTLVLGPGALHALGAVLDGVRHASGLRLVVCLPSLDEATSRTLTTSGTDHLVLITGRSGRLGRRRGVSPGPLAEAIDAADDIADPREKVVDLTDPLGWASLKLEPPG